MASLARMSSLLNRSGKKEVAAADSKVFKLFQNLVEEVDNSKFEVLPFNQDENVTTIFGRHLHQLPSSIETIVTEKYTVAVKIPQILKEFGNNILQVKQAEGIFRKPGNMIQIDELVEKLDSGRSLTFLAPITAHNLASLFKNWAQELPEPLIPWNVLPLFLHAVNNSQKSSDDTGLLLNFLAKLLPKKNRDSILYISHVLHSVAKMHEVNRMNCSNLAKVCPFIFTQLNGHGVSGASTRLMEFLISNPHTFLSGIENSRLPAFLANTESAVDLNAVDVLEHPSQPVDFTARFRVASPKPTHRIVSARSPIQSVRQLGKTFKDAFSKNSRRRKSRNVINQVGAGSSLVDAPEATSPVGSFSENTRQHPPTQYPLPIVTVTPPRNSFTAHPSVNSSWMIVDAARNDGMDIDDVSDVLSESITVEVDFGEVGGFLEAVDHARQSFADMNELEELVEVKPFTTVESATQTDTSYTLGSSPVGNSVSATPVYSKKPIPKNRPGREISVVIPKGFVTARVETYENHP